MDAVRSDEYAEAVHLWTQMTRRPSVDENTDADDDDESIKDLLSGPKDSVTMFTGSCRSRIQLDMSTGDDPLDLLAGEVCRRQSSGISKCAWRAPASSASLEHAALHAQVSVGNCERDESFKCVLGQSGSSSTMSVDGTASHKQELAFRCRSELHKELDLFLNASAVTSSNRVALDELHEKIIRKEHEALELRQRNKELERENQRCQQARDDCQADLEVAQLEKRRLQQQIDKLDQATQLAMDARELRQRNQELEQENGRCQADLEVAQLETKRLQQQIDTLDEAVQLAMDARATSCAGLDDARKKLALKEGIIDEMSSELCKLKGDRDVLRTLQVAELSSLADRLMESLA